MTFVIRKCGILSPIGKFHEQKQICMNALFERKKSLGKKSSEKKGNFKSLFSKMMGSQEQMEPISTEPL